VHQSKRKIRHLVKKKSLQKPYYPSLLRGGKGYEEADYFLAVLSVSSVTPPAL
jgi:hypothetical protein